MFPSAVHSHCGTSIQYSESPCLASAMCQHHRDRPTPFPASIQIRSCVLLSEYGVGMGGHVTTRQKGLESWERPPCRTPAETHGCLLMMLEPGQASPEGAPLAKSFLVPANWGWLFCHD